MRRKPAKKDLLSSQRSSLLLIKAQEEKEQQRRNEKGKEKDGEEADFEKVIPTKTRRRGETVGQEIVEAVFVPPPDENDEESPKDNNNTTTTVTTMERGAGSSIKKYVGPRRSLSLFNTNYFMYSSPVKNVKEFFMMQAPDPTRELHLVGEQFMISAKELVADGKYKDAFGFFEQGEEKYRNVVSTYADLKDAEVC